MDRRKKTVLIISFFYPPFTGPASLRITKFTKYLPEFGWKPIVLTVDNKGEKKEDKTAIRVVRTPYFDLQTFIINRFGGKREGKTGPKQASSVVQERRSPIISVLRFFQPIYCLPFIRTYLREPQGWYGYGVKSAIKIVENEKIDLIFSSYSPSASHFIAANVQHRTRIPWVADFRDLWSDNAGVVKVLPFTYFERQMEKRVMRNCDHMVTVSWPLAERLYRLHGKDTSVIYNGFDENDYMRSVPLMKKFTITYTGTVYEKEQDPTPLFEAVTSLRDEQKITPENFEVRFLGSQNFFLNTKIARLKLEKFINLYPTEPLEESIKRQKESTVLLLLGWNDPAETGVYTTKVFEYIASGRPVLSLSYEYEAVSRMIRDLKQGIVSRDAGEIKSILTQWLDEFKRKGDITSCRPTGNAAGKEYTRREQTRKLARIFDSAVDRP